MGQPDTKIAQQLTAIIAKKQSLEDQGYGDSFKKKQQVSDSSAPGAKHWFVLPEASELDKYEDMRVVAGAPITDVLRDRYERHYKSTIRDDIRHSNSLTSEEQFKRKKEIDRERAFVASYKDTSMVEDQDIFVHQVASKFITDQYDIVTSQVYNQENEARHYKFSGGKLIDIFDRDTKMHNISIEGSIHGAFTVSMKRRTDSGRIIDDVYDIVEFRDGRASNYAYSSKGNVALRADDVRRSVGQVNIALEKPRSAKITGGATEVVQEEVEQEHAVSPKVNAPTLQGTKEELPDVPKSKPSPSEDKIEEVDEGYVEVDDAIKPSGGVYNKGFLEAQLRTAVAGKNTSKTTIQYLVGQLAEAEGRRPEDLAQEFGIKDFPKKSSEETDPVKQYTPIEKEVAKKAPEKLLKKAKTKSVKQKATIKKPLKKAEKPKRRKKEKVEKKNSEELRLIKQELKKTFQPIKQKKQKSPTKSKKPGKRHGG